MPRKSRRSRDQTPPPGPPRWTGAPPWAQVPGHEVRRVGGEKSYMCPGCEHPIRVGVWHLVVVPGQDPDSRRHWHTECWRKELRRTRRL